MSAEDISATGSAVQGTAERQALANVIHDGACQCRGHGLGWTVRAMDADQIAEAVLAAGYVRLVEDEDTVERVARALAADALDRYVGDPSVVSWDEATEETRVELRASARAALQALRGDRDD